ncbi:hypothetical protein BD626DRAFT_591723, partial [Schizophyllum amplum]
KRASWGRARSIAERGSISQDSFAPVPARWQLAPPGPAHNRAWTRSRNIIPRGIQRLPPELLCAIFMMCGEPNDTFDYPRDDFMQSRDNFRNCRTPLYSRMTVLLGHVCSHWFAVTRGCPLLWTLVDVPLPQLCDVVNLKLALKFSSGLPLRLRLDDNHYTPPLNISIILKYEPGNVADIVEPLCVLSRITFTCLKRATIHLETDDKHASVTSRLWQLFYSSPALRTVQVFDVGIHAPLSTLRQLTHIGVTAIRPDKIMALLQACPQLEVLQAVVQPAPGIFPGKNDGYLISSVTVPIILPHLRMMMLRGMSDWTNFFNGLVVPRLARIDLSVARVQACAIQHMLQRSHARLCMLALRWLRPGNGDELKALLRCEEMQHLRILRYDPYNGPTQPLLKCPRTNDEEGQIERLPLQGIRDL